MRSPAQFDHPDLTKAEGAVVTEFGLVPISWEKNLDHLDFKFEVPEGVTASLRLPNFGGKAHLILDKIPVNSTSTDAFTITTEIKSGPHQGTLTFPADAATVAPNLQADFSDDFAKGNANWHETSGTWGAESGSYKQSDDSTVAVTSLKDHSWFDAIYTFSCQIDRAGDASNWAGFQFRKPDAASSHDAGGYLVYLRANGDLELFAGRVLQSVKTGLDTSKPIRFKVAAKDDHIQVYLNDETTARIDVHDSSFSEGFIGLETNHIHATFGPVFVTEKL